MLYKERFIKAIICITALDPYDTAALEKMYIIKNILFFFFIMIKLDCDMTTEFVKFSLIIIEFFNINGRNEIWKGENVVSVYIDVG